MNTGGIRNARGRNAPYSVPKKRQWAESEEKVNICEEEDRKEARGEPNMKILSFQGYRDYRPTVTKAIEKWFRGDCSLHLTCKKPTGGTGTDMKNRTRKWVQEGGEVEKFLFTIPLRKIFENMPS